MAASKTLTDKAIRAAIKAAVEAGKPATIKDGGGLSKNPPVLFARQTNINNGGQQQVNNGATSLTTTPAPAPVHAANSQVEKTEVLETSDGEWMDTGKASTAGRADPHLEAVGQVYWPAKSRRQGPSGPKR